MVFLFGRKKSSNSELPDSEDLPPPPEFDLSKDLPNLGPEDEVQTGSIPTIPDVSDVQDMPQAPEMPSFPEMPKEDNMGIEKTISTPSTEEKRTGPNKIINRKFEKVSREEAIHHDLPRGPLFVRMGDYRVILEDVASLKNHINEADNLLVRMNELKNEEDKQFEKWRVQLEDIERKLVYADKILFES